MTASPPGPDALTSAGDTNPATEDSGVFEHEPIEVEAETGPTDGERSPAPAESGVPDTPTEVVVEPEGPRPGA